MIRKYLYAGGICFVLVLALFLMLGLTGCHRPSEPVYVEHFDVGYATSGNATNGDANQGPPPTTTPMATEMPVEVQLPVDTGVAVEVTPTPMTNDAPVGELTTPETTPPPVPQPTEATPESIAAAFAGSLAAGEYNGLSAILDAVCYHDLNADTTVKAKYAAQLLDWYMESGRSESAVSKGAMGWLKREGIMDAESMQKFFADRQFISRLDSVYAVAVTLFDAEGQALLDAGSYVPANFPYVMPDIDEVFALLYDAFGEIKPQYVRLYQGEEYAGIITASANKLDPFTLNKALVDADVLANEVSVLYQEDKDGTLRLDFSEAFLTQLKELDKEQEAKLIRSLVNTISENLGYERMLFTVKGEPLKTANNTYQDPLTSE